MQILLLISLYCNKVAIDVSLHILAAAAVAFGVKRIYDS